MSNTEALVLVQDLFQKAESYLSAAKSGDRTLFCCQENCPMANEPSLKFSTYKDFTTELKKVYGGTAYNDFITSSKDFLIEKDGKLYCDDYSGTISANYRQVESISIKSVTLTKIVATAKIKFATNETMFETDPSKQKFVYQEVDYTFEKTNGIWVATTFPVPWRAND